MYEIFTFMRDDWGKLTQIRVGKMHKKLPTAIRICRKKAVNSFVKKYGERKPAFINNPEVEKLLNDSR